MKKSDLTESMPGKLVQATGYRRVTRGGLTEAVPVCGLAFCPNPLPPSSIDRDVFTGRLYDAVSLAERNLARLDATASSLPNPHLLLAPFRQREAKLSSQIEDIYATAEEIALVQADRSPARDEVHEVWNYVRALDHGLASPLPLCRRLFNEMHGILMSGVRGDESRPGEFRAVQNQIGGEPGDLDSARFVPPPPGPTLLGCLDEFEAFLNPDSQRPPRSVRYPRPIEAAMSHYQFEAVHPYRDGNGRLGRLIVALSLCKDGSLERPLVYVSAYFERHRQRYYDLLLRVSTHGEWEPWVRFFCDAVATQAEDGLRRAKALLSLRDRYVAAVTGPRASALLPQLITRLFERPAVRAPQAAEMLGVSVQAAQNLINQLLRKGILTVYAGGDYARVFIAKGVLDITEADDADSVAKTDFSGRKA